MKTNHLLLSAALMLGVVTANAQTGNFGIGVAAPTNKLHVKPTTVDPVRFEGIQTATDAEVLTTDPNGVVHKRTYPTPTVVTGGTGVTVTGSGTIGAPYVVNSSGGNGIGTSPNGYINTCGCNNTVEVGSGSSSAMLTAMTPAGVCAIAVPSGGSITVNLPAASSLPGRSYNIHYALPIGFSPGSNTFGIDVQATNGFEGSGSNAVGSELFYYAANNQSIGTATFLSNGAIANAPGGTVKGSPVVEVISDGTYWYGSQNSSNCRVIKP